MRGKTMKRLILFAIAYLLIPCSAFCELRIYSFEGEVSDLLYDGAGIIAGEGYIPDKHRWNRYKTCAIIVFERLKEGKVFITFPDIDIMNSHIGVCSLELFDEGERF